MLCAARATTSRIDDMEKIMLYATCAANPVRLIARSALARSRRKLVNRSRMDVSSSAGAILVARKFILMSPRATPPAAPARPRLDQERSPAQCRLPRWHEIHDRVCPADTRSSHVTRYRRGPPLHQAIVFPKYPLNARRGAECPARSSERRR